jgi:hypothetical protein
MGSTFDEKLWMERARKRLKTTGLSEEERTKVLAKYSEDVRHIQGLSGLVAWCQERGLKVLFLNRDGGAYYPEEKLLTTCKTTSPQHQLHILLHEIGHYLIGSPKKYQRFGMGYHDDEACERGTVHNRLDILEEEFEAWHLGWELGKKLRVVRLSDKPAFDRNRTRLLKQYVDWVAKGWKRPGKGKVKRSTPP